MNLDPVKGYAELARGIAVAVAAMLLTALLFIGGVYVGKGQSAKQLAAKDRVIATKSEALRNAGASLGAAATALREVNAEAERRIAAAAYEAEQAKLAGVAAAGAQAAADKRMATFDAEVARARTRPTCAALLAADVGATCGI